MPTATAEHEPATAKSADALEGVVAAALPEKASYRRRISFLWQEKDTSFYRVNFAQPEGRGFLSYWVTVTNGKASVSPEANAVFKSDKDR
ncbi:MAG TPA: hypothetical protein VHU81_21075 [Thermoanaerobaculia bacterium]|jgi:hypothetical protein|nr:hypothetical protein [Thermoanaerobaculia bacterium]